MATTTANTQPSSELAESHDAQSYNMLSVVVDCMDDLKPAISLKEQAWDVAMWTNSPPIVTLALSDTTSAHSNGAYPEPTKAP